MIWTASADGWPAEVVLGFVDGEVERLCALDPEREGVICLVALGGGAATPPPAAGPPEIRFEIAPLSGREVDYPDIRDAHGHGALETREEARLWRSAAPRARAPIAPPRGPLLELPKPDPWPVSACVNPVSRACCSAMLAFRLVSVISALAIFACRLLRRA